MQCAPAFAQDAADEPASETAVSAAPANGQSYEPAYFEQFAPRNARDMVARIPGFSISDGGGGQRGLGQATGNVLINGKRFSGKSESLRDQLSRIPAADVVRIDIVEGATLDIPGLTGQVANVIVNNTGASGQFRWNTGFRAHNTEAQLYGGEVSLTGKSGALDFTVALSNRNDRFGADGPNILTDGTGALIETQDTKFSGKFDNPKLATNFTYDFGGDVLAHFNASYGEDFFSRNEPETGFPVSGPVRTRDLRTYEDGPEYELSADLAFPLGPGALKLIALERFERDNFSTQLMDSFDDGSDPEGFRFTQIGEAGERIGRFEYGWNMWSSDWQISGEAAFNRLNRVSGLFELAPDGTFTQLAFPEGTGGVRESRYDGSLSFGTQLTPKLSLQAIAGAEYSQIEQTGVAANARTFLRPKGSLALAWNPADDFDLSLELRRQVGQLSFGDFLASVALDDGNENAGNNELVPDQSWKLDFEMNKRLGAWGSAKLTIGHAWFEDFIDFFPVGATGEARGNIGNAQRTSVGLSGTIKLDPLGINGAQIEANGVRRWMRVTDPFVGVTRPFSRDTVAFLDLDFRHDIPGSDIAYGASLFTEENAPYSRRFEIGRDFEGPSFVSLFVEHKDVMGLTVNASVGNVAGARQKNFRTVFADPRPGGDVLFNEQSDRRIGPMFRFSVSGNF
ncbi:hypothetical protein FEV51_04645 [Qipengyuania marisflavi]|uniref:TonB-dependent receptor plug domain-containing protein n=2 Tax=Qipengyuania marisflavi TaxID=2486356 RepID=A0A5S3PZ39_9SPHN|nr:hypothetical protein FEV51_04645 [Qipengyuania marisflavi]